MNSLSPETSRRRRCVTAVRESRPSSALLDARASQRRVQVRLEADAQVALHGMDRDAALGDERADRVAVADVDADVLVVAPHDQVPDLGIRPADTALRLEPVVVARDAAVQPDAVLQTILVKRVPDEAGAVEQVRAPGAELPLIAELGMRSGVHLLVLGW